ncbi:flagellar basal body rod protein FlgG [Bacillus sp. FJAT-45350]|uniref:flagellar basal body rod protein FlgG n=1 Tax=Bacillus sp. FJAT-45350 TaxID=2011014 RepID=UPI000BB7A9BD|nr:flagellar basal body rod protein FlgG [Bacillus sp. FJAT-45350]
MLRSMYAGVSGMKNFQAKLDVIGNNISNVNTFGFKKGRTTFQDLVSQQLNGATGPTVFQGGRNASQVGLGSSLASIDTIHTQGSLQNTGRELDLGISGDGFFVVGRAIEDGLWEDPEDRVADPDEINLNYTRAGNFYLDKNGFIVNTDGLYLMGKTSEDEEGATSLEDIGQDFGRIKIPSNAQSFSIGADGTINYINSGGELRIAGQLILANFANPDGLQKVGSNLYQVTANSGIPIGEDDGLGGGFGDEEIMWESFSSPGLNGTGQLVAGALEMSNVDLSEEFTEMIVAQRGFQANTRMITTSDEILQELINLKR